LAQALGDIFDLLAPQSSSFETPPAAAPQDEDCLSELLSVLSTMIGPSS
jgi:hypothetical protein